MLVQRLAVRCLTLLALVVPLLVFQPAGVTTAHEDAARAGDRTVTLSGTYELLAALTTSGEHELHAVRTRRGAFWLDLADVHPPSSGARVAVTGRRTTGRTIAVTALRVISKARTATRAPRRTRVLVMRAHWGARPASPTTGQTRSIFLRKGNAWFRQVSHGRYHLTGTVTPWLRIKKPAGCTTGALTAMNRAKARAAARGFKLARYQRFLLYLPCDGSGMVGLGSQPGAHVWQFGSLAYDVALHEQGHNLGLGHANTRECRHGGQQVTWSGSCTVQEYADPFDVMGNRSAGQFQAHSKRRLGWLQRLSTMTSSGTRTLRPHATTGAGTKAVRVRASRSRSYWLEYRTPRGVDAGLPRGSFGVHLRVQSGSSTPQLLDAMPGSGYGFASGDHFTEWDHVRLLPGSSWTSPEGIRFTTLSQRRDSARVAVRFRAGRPKAPAAPSAVRATATGDAVAVTWKRPADHGSVITEYVVTASPGGASQKVPTVGGLVTSAWFTGLDPATSYTFDVRAFNHVGASPAARSNAVVPSSILPLVTLTAPIAGSVLTSPTTLTASAAPGPGSGAPISTVDFFANGFYIGSDWQAPWSMQWEPEGFQGPVVLTALAIDVDGESATSTPVAVTVDAGS